MEHRICPVWLGYFLSSPLRKLYHNPDKILGPYVKEGMTVLDVGCAMGFFTLPMAGMAGPGGRVIAVDIQEKMLASLKKRAVRAGLAGRIEARLSAGNSLSLEGLGNSVDFALASAVVHEVPDARGFFQEIYCAMKKGGKLLVIEPGGHVTEEEFEKTLSAAVDAGFIKEPAPPVKGSRSVLFVK